MNATKTSQPPSTFTIVICSTFPVLLLLCICLQKRYSDDYLEGIY